MTRALVVDPGKMTGYGWLLTGPDKLDPADQRPEFLGGELAHEEFVDACEFGRWVRPKGPGDPAGLDLVICERFTISTRTIREATGNPELWSVEQFGHLRTWCRRSGVPFRAQLPSDMKFGDNGKLKALGWYAPRPGVKGERGHRRDAARHALKWGVDNGAIDPALLLAR